jgi:hypothetical protein
MSIIFSMEPLVKEGSRENFCGDAWVIEGIPIQVDCSESIVIAFQTKVSDLP